MAEFLGNPPQVARQEAKGPQIHLQKAGRSVQKVYEDSKGEKENDLHILPLWGILGLAHRASADGEAMRCSGGLCTVGRKVLLTEDSETQAMLLTLCLTNAGFEVIRAENGEEALALAVNERPDVVVLDVFMPGIDGFEVCRRLKAHEASKDLPVIILSMVAEDGRAGSVGATDFISKHDLDVEQLVKRCQELAEQHE